MVQLPTHRPPMHPGRMLERILEEQELTQVELAKLLDVPFQRVNLIVNRRRAITPDTALRLAKLFDTTPGFWMNLQQAWDLWHAEKEAAGALEAIQPRRTMAGIIREPITRYATTYGRSMARRERKRSRRNAPRYSPSPTRTIGRAHRSRPRKKG